MASGDGRCDDLGIHVRNGFTGEDHVVEGSWILGGGFLATLDDVGCYMYAIAEYGGVDGESFLLDDLVI